ncbi:hypothetical protein B566_EDAN001692 [Ephemera danica]|nr:hypothetical protein B566_EDAN001692 [Ephemera danica]
MTTVASSGADEPAAMNVAPATSDRFGMAGVVPISVRTKARRKQWTLHDGPRSSLRLLQGQLAEDGCPEAQVALAKQLLEETAAVEEKEENARLAVYWLIKASEQGHLDATDILKHCLEIGQGITEHNFLDVQACLNMSQEEKLARRAARQLFNSLSAGQDFITTDQLHHRIRRLQRGRSRRHKSHATRHQGQAVAATGSKEEDASSSDDTHHPGADWTSRVRGRCYAGEKLTEDYMVSAAATYVRGELPLVQRVLVLADPERGRLEQIGFVQRSVLHPWASAVLLYTWLLEFLARHGSALFMMMLPTSPVHTFVLLACYWLAGAESLAWLLAMMLFYISFGFMVISTMEMLQKEREFRHFRVWSQLFLSYSASPEETGGGLLDSTGAEGRFLQAGLGPYARFFAALLLHVLAHPLVSPAWVPHSELTILATVLSSITLFAFMDSIKRPDGLMLLSFALNVLARYPYEFDAVVQGWQFLDLRAPAFASAIVGRGVEFCLTYRGLLHLAVTGLLVRMAFRDGWRGVCRSFVPHCVALAWWQVAVLSAEGATRFGLVRAAFAFVGLALCVPLAGIMLLLLPAFAAARSLASSTIVTRASVTAALVAVPVAMSWWLAQRHRRGGRLAGQFILIIQFVCGALAIASLLYPLIPNSMISPFPTDASLTRAATESSQLPQQTPSSAVTKISNPLAGFLQLLPSPVTSFLTCLLGQHTPTDCLDKSLESQRCQILHHVSQSCHIENWSSYKMAVGIKMKSGGMWGMDAEIALHADHNFRNFTIALRPGDRVWFQGYLNLDGLGGRKPTVQLEQIGCLGCHKTDLASQRKPSPFPFTIPSISDILQTAIQSVLGFVLGPIIRFT